MMRFVVVATSARGTLAEPEMLDDANQWRALVSATAEPVEDPGLPRWRATGFMQAERDRAICPKERDLLTCGDEGRERVKRLRRVDPKEMERPAARRRVG